MKPTFKEVPSETATGQVVCACEGQLTRSAVGCLSLLACCKEGPSESDVVCSERKVGLMIPEVTSVTAIINFPARTTAWLDSRKG